MSRGQTLRALVNERLAAAAEDIFVLFERTIVEYEEELRRSKEENQRRLQFPSSSPGPGPGLNQEITETPWFKEEPEEENVKQEEEQLQVPVPESSDVQEETQGEDISSEPDFHSETDHWEPFSWSAAQMETEPDGHHYNQVQIRDKSTELSPQNKSAPETSVHSGHMSRADGGAEGKKLQCPFCHKRFMRKENLERHIRVHTGERPYSCTVCDKTFTDQTTFRRHKVVHTGERTFICPVCNKNFAHKYTLEYHSRTHTGEKPYSCTVCEKTFADNSTFRRHVRIHTGEQPFSCSVCKKTFARKDNLRSHMGVHSL